MTRETVSLKMNFILLAVGLVAIQVCSYVNCDDEVPNSTPLTKNVLKPDATKTSCDPDKFFECRGCSTRLICDAKGEILATRNCGGTTPYCNEGMCVEEPPPTCPPPVSSLCPKTEQIYPSLVSCQQYIMCDANRKPTEYVCPGNLVYAGPKKLCKRKNNSRECPVIDCRNNLGKFIVYPLQKDIYFYCGAQSDTKILQCADGENYEFNVAELRCEPKCKEGNLIMPATSKREYYMCTSNNDGGFDKFLMTCPSGTTFNVAGCA